MTSSQPPYAPVPLPGHAAEAWAEWERALFAGKDPVRELAEGRLQSRWAREQLDPYEVPGARAKLVAEATHFRVYVPLSGGMDSTTCWEMAKVAALPAEAVYVDCGQEYARVEYAHARAIAGRDIPLLDAPTTPRRVDYRIPGRNPAIILAVAREMAARGHWGEIWFGNLAGESPAIGGDKSSRFMLTMQQMLTLSGFDARIVQPLIGMDKPDLVDWWTANADLNGLIGTHSCYGDGDRECGTCLACLRKVLAFTSRHIDVRARYASLDFGGVLPKLRDEMLVALEAGDFTRYARSRCTQTLAAMARLNGWQARDGGATW